MINENLLNRFTLRREGFNEKINVGDLLDYKGKRYVIIVAYSVKLKRTFKTGNPLRRKETVCKKGH